MNWKPDEQNSFQENLETEIGILTLEKIGSSDRGSYRFTMMPTSVSHNKILDLIPLYFFDEKTAKAEVEQWLARMKEIGLTQRIGEGSLLATHLLHGRHCMLTTGEVSFALSGLRGYFFNVVTAKELEFILTVDCLDQLPRFYMQEQAALSEATLWLQRRKEANNLSQWEQI